MAGFEETIKTIEKPEWKWYYSFPFTRGRRDYLKDRKRYDLQFLTQAEKIRNNEMVMINSVSVLLITGITSLWTLLPPLTTLPNWLGWMNMGMDGFGTDNWGNQLMLTIVPAGAGTIIHKCPNMVPNKAIRTGINLAIKIIPVIILTLCWYIIHQEKKVHFYKQQEKNATIGL